ncbi:MAG: Gfo/Idh/MocA family protein, partial [Chloroflexota bacterium]
MDRVKIALVGCGSIARAMHLPGITTIEEMGLGQLVAVCDTVEEMARTAAERFGVPRFFSSLEALFAGADFDLLVNTTPIPQHVPVTLAALRAGKHVYTQKPMAST